jgi:hypothetical protein
MDQGTDAIRRSIDERRASIDTRLELLEAKARRLHPRNYLGWLALGSVVAADRRRRRYRAPSRRRPPSTMVVKDPLGGPHAGDRRGGVNDDTRRPTKRWGPDDDE